MSDMIRNYGYYGDGLYKDQRIYAEYKQAVAGYPLGIIGVEIFFPILPGNVCNAWTYDFPVRVKMVEGATVERMFKNDPTLLDEFKAAGDELIADGCRAITGACGYFANFQKELAEHFSVPTAMSSLLQVPWIKSTLKKDEKIGVICANGSALSSHTLKSVGIEDESVLVVRGLEDTKEFGPLVAMQGNSFNPDILGQEIVEKALDMCKTENIGAILLECSDLPPFAHLVQKATNLPVFDYISLHHWMYRAVCQRPYTGFF